MKYLEQDLTMAQDILANMCLLGSVSHWVVEAGEQRFCPIEMLFLFIFA